MFSVSYAIIPIFEKNNEKHQRRQQAGFHVSDDPFLSSSKTMRDNPLNSHLNTDVQVVLKTVF